LYSFHHRGRQRGCEVFNEAEPMYPEATIKASFPKISNHNIKIAIKVSSVFDKRILLKMKP
jgi:hypothetical protein